jgi:quercetin dioxygenase-like cupin family protein
MVGRLAAVAATACMVAATCTWAQTKIVPIEEEPMHKLKFENAHVRFFDVQLPPGYESLWHSHVFDGVFVNISPSETTAQDLGGEPTKRDPRIVGQTNFIDYAKKPKVHRVTNSGATVYRVTDAEIHSGCGGFGKVTDGTGQTLILENDRVRVTRIMIEPGETIALHPPCGMLVAVSEGRLTSQGSGPEEKITLRPADFRWRESNAPVVYVNAGDRVLHAVDIVVK